MSFRLLSVKPAIYVPTLYFVQGLPYAMVTLMSVVMFKNLGAGNEYIGFITSYLTLPWVLKPFWAPIIDLIGSRRNWVLVAHMVLGALSAILAFAALTPYAITVATVLFAVIALVSATQDIAMDGFYMDVLDKSEQALFVGFRNAAYKVAWLTGQGALVFLAGKVAEQVGFHSGWCASFAVCSFLFFVAAAFHSLALPKPRQAHAGRNPADSSALQLRSQFKQVFATFFCQPGAAAIVFYILTFRLGDALMLKMTVPFLLDRSSCGGLAISTVEESLIYGTIGTIFLLLGGIIGSWILSRFGLRRCLLPAAILQSAAIPLYLALAVFRPGLEMVACVNAFEQFSYGIGSTAYTVYLLSTVRAEFRASHYAIATGLMALGLMIPGSVSGYLTRCGYPLFFLISFIASIPGIISIKFLPFRQEEELKSREQSAMPATGH